MNTFAKRALWGTLLAGGITLFGATVANAAETDGDDGILSGTQALVGIDIPIDVSGLGVSILGDASSVSAPAPAASAPAPAPAAPSTSGADGTASGTQAIVNVSVPVTVTGVAVSGTGDSSTAAAPAPAAPAPAPSAPTASTDGSDGAASGTQALVDLNVPVTVSGLSLALLGDSSTTGAAPAPAEPVDAPPAAAPTTSGDDGILGGTQVIGGVNAPITVTGNAISVLGDSSSTGTAAAPAEPAGASTGTAVMTSGEDGILGGTQVTPDVTAPVNVTGNAISVLGDSASTGTTAPATPAGATPGDGATTTGDDGVLGGTQVTPDVTAPVNVTGNAISVLGDSASTGTTAPATPAGATPGDGATTTGDDGVLGGTQIAPDVALPITIGGNAISVAGDSSTTTTVPTEPGGPVVPTDPTDPVDPTDPTDPGDGGDGEAIASEGGAMVAALDVRLLAETGGSGALGALALGFVLIAVGAGVFAVRARHA